MSTTVKELAKKLNLKRNSIEMRMNHIPDFRKKYVTHQGNKLIISDEGGKLICKLNGGVKKGVNKSVNDTVNDNNRVSDYKINTLQKLLNQERKHNNQLQKQLNTINGSNKHLGKLLDQQQQLQLSTQRETDRLRGQIKHLKTITGPVDKSTDKTQNRVQSSNSQAKASSSSFWHRFFNKL